MTSPAARSAASTRQPPAWVQRPASLAHALTEELVERIVQGRYVPGSPVPRELALCEEFGVSRTVVREAVKMLQEKGLVQVRQGAGTIVTPPVRWNMLDAQILAASIAEDDTLAVLDDVVVTRRLLESDMANMAARRATDEVVARLRQLVDEMDELVGDPATYADHDRAFHDVVMQTSGNRIARAVVRSLESQVIRTARYLGRTERALCVASNRGHRRIYEHIAAHDPAGAADAMFTHITDAWLVRRGEAGDPLRLER
jgi:DNA-binding FadR family transcriptional regulator